MLNAVKEQSLNCFRTWLLTTAYSNKQQDLSLSTSSSKISQGGRREEILPLIIRKLLIMTLEYQHYTNKNTFIPKKVHRNHSCYRSHHNWHCNESDLSAAQFSSILWWCRVIYMKETHMPSSYKWVSYQRIVLKQKGNTKKTLAQYLTLHAHVLLYQSCIRQNRY